MKIRVHICADNSGWCQCCAACMKKTPQNTKNKRYRSFLTKIPSVWLKDTFHHFSQQENPLTPDWIVSCRATHSFSQQGRETPKLQRLLEDLNFFLAFFFPPEIKQADFSGKIHLLCVPPRRMPQSCNSSSPPCKISNLSSQAQKLLI